MTLTLTPHPPLPIPPGSPLPLGIWVGIIEEGYGEYVVGYEEEFYGEFWEDLGEVLEILWSLNIFPLIFPLPSSYPIPLYRLYPIFLLKSS
ncbi:hypothetical protein AGABI2DRAFT_117924 [Agaricus bisporus var. bisporus H97]|uniref:hypothetical protein n=1 Tax=Agaricus bisporus var. bisporus (strain H97 / ATCC MYA-4626 / FGSC 10389) TaxID=936046 RepID=UPI00029F69F5|nr:hypothetical protein AGABI2DRAFT_117924 [Agaricus bisporus var. bisporus H97]EKV47347.1 hypothetical protein AGABI2DRAFT_117924 [Agaricus bisporus var. bisporus H97]